ncbi:MAG: hypothetical protein ACFBSE_09080 [Prochloraceae cyanobacterium]
MKPKFKDTLSWEQAQVLMQPTFIRVLDNLRKELERSSWQGTYQEIETPIPGYQLCLSRNERSIAINIWDLCFQVCFRDYNLDRVEGSQNSIAATQLVEIDTDLLDETGKAVDWQSLETKTQHLVKQVFANLP